MVRRSPRTALLPSEQDCDDQLEGERRISWTDCYLYASLELVTVCIYLICKLQTSHALGPPRGSEILPIVAPAGLRLGTIPNFQCVRVSSSIALLLISTTIFTPPLTAQTETGITMESMPAIKMTPVAPTGSQIISGNQRMTILTDGLLRLETTQDGKFEDRASTFAINRDLSNPKFDLTKKDNGAMEIVTDRLFIQWTGEAFGPTTLMVTLRRKGKRPSKMAGEFAHCRNW